MRPQRSPEAQARSARDLNLFTGSAFTLATQVATYGLAGVTGIILARALGAEGRGVYGLAVTIAMMYAAVAELGMSKAGVYLMGQGRYTRQQVASGNLAWALALGLPWLAGALLLGLLKPDLISDDFGMGHLAVIAVGGPLLLLLVLTQDLIIATGSVLGYNLVDFAQPLLRAVFIVGGIVALGAGVVGVLAGWLLGVALATALALWLLARRVRLRPAFRAELLREQLSFGIRGSLGFILQAANQRLDVFLVAAFVGSAALGQYTVAYGTAELLWQIPLALGVVFFPKAASLAPDANAETAAVTCRRALFVTLAASLVLLALGRPLIVLLYGSEFAPAVTAFYILVPSASLYTVYKVLSNALAARGMPEAGLYGGLVSAPLTVVLGLVLIPSLGIAGAALTSVAAYGANAAVVLACFLRVTGKPLHEVLLVRWADVSSSLQAVRAALRPGTLRPGRQDTVGVE